MPVSVIHNANPNLRARHHFVLVRPEQSGNVGAVARALANMEIQGRFLIVGSDSIVTGESERWAMHAKTRLAEIEYFPSLAALREQVRRSGQGASLWVGTSSRVGSSKRPHPISVEVAVERAVAKVASDELHEVYWVFGAEGSGLTNAEMDLCDAIAFIPTGETYDSLNLAQAVLIFGYEIHRQLLPKPEAAPTPVKSQKGRLIHHLLQVAEEAGFILPGDPYKMKPRLETILDSLPKHIPEAKTLHGLLDQVLRSIRNQGPDFKGRFRRKVIQSEVREV